eukprot:scaffold87561_cov35-Prasinocladus_malaysianus.AAC.1
MPDTDGAGILEDWPGKHVVPFRSICCRCRGNSGSKQFISVGPKYQKLRYGQKAMKHDDESSREINEWKK